MASLLEEYVPRVVAAEIMAFLVEHGEGEGLRLRIVQRRTVKAMGAD